MNSSNSRFRRSSDRFETTYHCLTCNLTFPTKEKLEEHWRLSDTHLYDFCRFCGLLFADKPTWEAHARSYHFFCKRCCVPLLTARGLGHHVDIIHGVLDSGPPVSAKVAPHGPIPAHYATLGLDPQSSQAQVVRVARLQRIMCHPDRLLREKGLSKEEVERVNVRAKAVGEAADILSDPKERAKYDAANQREKGRW